MRPGIELKSPRPLMNTLPLRPMSPSYKWYKVLIYFDYRVYIMNDIFVVHNNDYSY